MTPDYFKTFGIDLVQGRAFTAQDTASSVRVAIVNQEFARRYLQGKDPLQQRILIEEIIPGVQKLGPPIVWQIVGVSHNVRYGDLRDDGAAVDVPFSQSLSPGANIAVRTAADPAVMSRTIAAAVHSIDSQVALAHLRTMDEVKDESLANDRFTMLLYESFALVALVLAAVGIYGLMAFSVSQRTQEIGLRMALGASRQHVTTLILREGFVLALLGLGLGMGGAILVGRTMHSALYGVAQLDFLVVAFVAGILLLTALGRVLPARTPRGIHRSHAGASRRLASVCDV